MAGTLENNVAIVAGPSSMLGAATAHLLATEGARVALTAPPSASAHLDAVAAQIRDTGGHVLSLPATLGTRAQARALVRRVVDEWDRLDILVVADGYDATADNADGASARPRLGQPHSAVRGLLHLATAALPQMERQGGGDIVAVAPVAGRVLRPNGVASARVALEVAALCDSLRRQASPRGVRVAVVEPDGLAPDDDADDSTMLSTADVADAILYVLTRPPRVSIAEVFIRPA